MKATEPAQETSPPKRPRTLGSGGLFARTIPKDGGTMLAAATVLGSLSFFSHLEQVHIGSGPIPAWIPLALDAAIAGAAGAILTLGAGLFGEDEPRLSSEYVVVAKPVWESVQHEVVAARAQKAAAQPPVPVVPSVALHPLPPPPPPLLNPWDEGPPTSHGGPGSAEPAAMTGHPAATSIPSGTASPAAPGPRPPGPSDHPAAIPAPGTGTSVSGHLVKATQRSAATQPPAPPAPAVLSQAELEDIARMGGILGIVPLKGETGAEYSRRLARARDAMSKPSPPVEPQLTRADPPRPEIKPEGNISPDIDELMAWLEKVAAEQAHGSPTVPPKKDGPKGDPTTTEKTSA
ncbi:MAG: hypothetical protein ACLQC7_08570 [Thermoplasmata archaeon]